MPNPDFTSSNGIEEGTEFQPQWGKDSTTPFSTLPLVVQNYDTLEVILVGSISKEALKMSLEKKEVVLWSKSRQEIWHKGKTSGDFLEIKEVRVNCEQNAFLFLVRLKGQGACHTKKNNQPRSSCFYRRLKNKHLELLF